jgi:PhnB protein
MAMSLVEDLRHEQHGDHRPGAGGRPRSRLGASVNLDPFLLFDADCAEAMTFYQSCLGGELTVIRVADTPMKEQAPTENHQKVSFAHLRAGAIGISATDWQHPTRQFDRGNNVGLYLTSDDSPALRAAFARLSDGADPVLLDPLVDMPFGLYGHLCDRFRIHWFFRGGPPDPS